jgi:hypothetical protein
MEQDTFGALDNDEAHVHALLGRLQSQPGDAMSD